MARLFDTQALIDRVGHYTLMPTSQSVFTDDNLVDILNEELHEYIVPFLLNQFEDYMVTYVDKSLVSGTTEYDLPTDAVGDKLKDVKVVYANGEERSIPRRRTGSKQEYFRTTSGQGVPGWFELRDNKILIPDPGTTISDPVLRLYYYRRPSELVSPDDWGKVATVDDGTDVITYETAVTTGSSIYQATALDIQKGSPFYTKLSDSLTVGSGGSDATTTQVTFSSADLSSISVGDYVVPEDKAAIPQVPRECMNLLCIRTAITVLRARGLNPLAGDLEMKAAQVEQRLQIVLQPRVDDEKTPVFNSNSPLRQMVGPDVWGR